LRDACALSITGYTHAFSGARGCSIHNCHFSGHYERITKVYSVLLTHSAWSESSAARPRPRGGHRKGEKSAPGAFATLERRARRAEPTFGLCFRAKAPKETNGEARRRRSPLSWRLIKNAKFQRSSSRHRVFSREPIRHSVVDCPLCSHSFAANHITAFYCAYTVRNCSKIIKND